MNKMIKRVGIAIILFLAIQLVMQIIFMIGGLLPVILNTLKHNPDEIVAVFEHNATSENLATPLCLSTIISSALTIFVFWKYKYVPFDFRKSWTVVPSKTLIICVPLMLCAMFFLNVLTEQLQLSDHNEAMFLAMSKTGIWGFLAIAVFGPFCEEFTFRGAVQGTLQKTTSPWTAILISALLFGIIHMNPIQIPFAFVLGIFFGWLYYRTGSLIPGLLAHIINNTVGFITIIVSDDPDQTTEKLLGKGLTWSLMALAVILFLVLFFVLNKTLTKDFSSHKKTI